MCINFKKGGYSIWIFSAITLSQPVFVALCKGQGLGNGDTNLGWKALAASRGVFAAKLYFCGFS